MAKPDDRAFEYYLEKTYLKTGSLIAKSCRASAILSNATDDVVEAAYIYGRNLGIGFQLIDDLLDFTVSAKEFGKPVGADLELGLATAPVLYAWQEYPELGPLVSRKFSNEGDVPTAWELVHKSQGLERTKLLAKMYVDRAREALEVFPPSLAREALERVTQSVLTRTNLHSFNQTLYRAFHNTSVRLNEVAKPQPSVPERQSPDPKTEIKLPMYDMPMFKQIRHLRMVFLVNVFCSTALSLWVRTDDIYTVLAAGAIMAAGFIPLAFVQLMYYDHIKSVRILGAMSRKQLNLKKSLGPDSQIEFPVVNETPLLITKYSLSGSDPSTPLYVRDLVPGTDRKRSVQWLIRGTNIGFRVSKKVIQYHPDMRALDQLIRANAKKLAGAKSKQA
ncbi:coq1 putative hexaprenyl diphosphate synthase [Linderina macrospora]|uniref:Coq1 putative hexaprenyl diphosphate synthase n=1 Tax=Linderina macrospora TaxID=4868 RepID=A0ACC1JB94_9FUNG|nr:coq1 putative hexaprenyl diphosphate synthase [Linderina macrospora]